MTYIVVSENEIVKAEMERPSFSAWEIINPCVNKDRLIKPFQQHCLSLPRIPIEGKHKWKLWQEVVEGKDFNLEGGEQKYEGVSGFSGRHYTTTPLVAIPIQPTPEGEKVPCNQCGGKLASVRGRYPGDPERMVCPTCVVEELESLKQNNSTAKNTTNDNL